MNDTEEIYKEYMKSYKKDDKKLPKEIIEALRKESEQKEE